MGAVRHRAAPPGGGGNGAEAGASQPFLASGLGRAAAVLGAGLGGVRALAAVGLISHQHLVHDGQVGLQAEDGVIGVDGAKRLARAVDHGQFHGRFLVWVTRTRPWGAPGTEPKT